MQYKCQKQKTTAIKQNKKYNQTLSAS